MFGLELWWIYIAIGLVSCYSPPPLNPTRPRVGVYRGDWGFPWGTADNLWVVGLPIMDLCPGLRYGVWRVWRVWRVVASLMDGTMDYGLWSMDYGVVQHFFFAARVYSTFMSSIVPFYITGHSLCTGSGPTYHWPAPALSVCTALPL